MSSAYLVVSIQKIKMLYCLKLTNIMLYKLTWIGAIIHAMQVIHIGDLSIYANRADPDQTDMVSFKLTLLWADSADDKLIIFFLFFSQKIGFDISYKLSPWEIICMKCQILFSGKNKKNISEFCLLKFSPTIVLLNKLSVIIKKTCLFKYTENFTTKK